MTADRIRRELYPVRNVHQAFGAGLLRALRVFGAVVADRGLVAARPDPSRRPGTNVYGQVADYYRERGRADGTASNAVKVDRALTFDKLTNVHYSGTRHDEDQPVAPDRAGHRHLPHPMPRGVRQPVRAVLSRQRL